MRILRASWLVAMCLFNLVLLATLLAIASLDGLVSWAMTCFDRRMVAHKEMLATLREITETERNRP